MSAYEEFFKGKKITMLGLGLLGRGVGDAEFLAESGAQLHITDKKTEAELAESVERLKKYPNITYFFGGHREEDFTKCDMVIKSAGVPLASPEIAAARAANIPIYMSTALFAKFARDLGATIVGVTGTRGKSTVTNMINHTLVINGKQTVLGGNVRGVSTLAQLPKVEQGTICVLELDSWQLQGFGDLQMSPNIAVFTNLMPDHLNYYPNMDAYFSDKANIFRYQRDIDVLIVGESVVERARASKPPSVPKIPAVLPIDCALLIPGEHNRVNAALAAQALRALNLSEEQVQKGLESFPGVEGRLQYVREVNGVKIYNDNNATTPEATIAALNSFTERSIILIMGGSDKGLDLEQLTSEVARTCKKVLFLAGTGTEKLRAKFNAHVYDSVQSAVKDAMLDAHVGDVVLFSPAFASFGAFKNEYDRNDQFMQVVKSL